MAANLLNEQVEILFQTKPSLRRAFLFGFFYAGSVAYGRIATDLDPRFAQLWWASFGVFLLLTIWALLRRATTSYVITAEEIQRFSGILARRAVIIPLQRVTNTGANQSFLERILGLVSLQIDSAGGDTAELVFERILKTEALEAARIIRELRKRAAIGSSTQSDAAAAGGY